MIFRLINIANWSGGKDSMAFIIIYPCLRMVFNFWVPLAPKNFF